MILMLKSSTCFIIFILKIEKETKNKTTYMNYTQIKVTR